MANVSFGIIGCGMMGQEHLRNIALVPGARVAAIFEPDPGMRQIAQTMVPDAVFAASARKNGGCRCQRPRQPQHPI